MAESLISMAEHASAMHRMGSFRSESSLEQVRRMKATLCAVFACTARPDATHAVVLLWHQRDEENHEQLASLSTDLQSTDHSQPCTTPGRRCCE